MISKVALGVVEVIMAGVVFLGELY